MMDEYGIVNWERVCALYKQEYNESLEEKTIECLKVVNKYLCMAYQEGVIDGSNAQNLHIS